jgi:pyruvate kinase
MINTNPTFPISGGVYLEKNITKSKIICTLGPATSTAEEIRDLAELGMDCARINFSHGTMKDKAELFRTIRHELPELSILCDIQGPKIRIGRVKEGGVVLKRANKLIVTTDDVEGTEEKITISYPKLPEEITPDELIYINDGIVCLKAESIHGTEIVCSILSGGFISTRKGVNLPNTEISLKVPTEKDLDDLKLIAELNPEFVAISFVGNADDVKVVREILTRHGNDKIRLISKIERPVAVKNITEILEASDGIMVARGDLGVELPPEQVLPVQKDMIRKANIAGKPIIVATQMLESMIKAPVPTRAEVSDVFNAIEDGADAVMLSAETASGDYPREAVTIMEKVIKSSEALIPDRNPDDYDSENETIAEVIGHLVYSACVEFNDMGYTSGKIICITQTGHSARMISKYRPNLSIIGVTPEVRTARELKLQWGVEPLLLPKMNDIDKTRDKIKVAVNTCLKEGFITKSENLIIAGNFFDLPHKTNMVSIFSVEDVLALD